MNFIPFFSSVSLLHGLSTRLHALVRRVPLLSFGGLCWCWPRQGELIPMTVFSNSSEGPRRSNSDTLPSSPSSTAPAALPASGRPVPLPSHSLHALAHSPFPTLPPSPLAPPSLWQRAKTERLYLCEEADCLSTKRRSYGSCHDLTHHLGQTTAPRPHKHDEFLFHFRCMVSQAGLLFPFFLDGAMPGLRMER